MPSKAEQIAARIAALLTAAPGYPAAGNVYRDRADAFARSESPATLVECLDEDTDTLGGSGLATSVQQDKLRIAVTQAVRGAAWQTTADACRVAAHALIVVDPTLRGIASDIVRDRCEWRAASADQPFGYCAQIYRFTFHTRGLALDSSL